MKKFKAISVLAIMVLMLAASIGSVSAANYGGAVIQNVNGQDKLFPANITIDGSYWTASNYQYFWISSDYIEQATNFKAVYYWDHGQWNKLWSRAGSGY